MAVISKRPTDRSMRTVAMCALVLALQSAPAQAQEAAPEPNPDRPAASGGSPQDVEAGKQLYTKWCVNCHGEQGDGAGPGADFLQPRPRDFRNGLFKIRSTAGGKLPSDQDLFDVITYGMPGTSMPAWDKVLTEPERRQVAQYIKTFSRRFARSKETPEPITLGARVAASRDSIAKGKELFTKIECFKCHGEGGRANGPSAPELTDDWGFPIRPANLTKPWNFRGGHAAEDLYTRIQSGISGTPMPSFADSLSADDTWHVVNYVMSLWPNEDGSRPPLKVVLRAKRVEDAIPEAPSDPFWDERESFSYPLVGQVIEDPRLFAPSVDAVAVQAVFNDAELALRLVWDDPTPTEPDEAAGRFEDAVAVQLPVQIPTGAKRPFFLMGDGELSVQLLRWSSAGGGTVSELNGRGIARVEPQAAASRQTQAAGEYVDGQYRVVIKRPLTTGDAEYDIQFEAGRFIPIAFFVWDGDNGERGGQAAISHWYYFLLEPALPTTVYVYPIVGVVAAAGLQWWMIRRLRRRPGA